MQAQAEPDEKTAELLEAIRVTPDELKELGDLCAGRNLGRNSSVQLAAIRTKLEYTLPKPEQRHELSGQVTIRVECAIPGDPGSQAKVLSDATVDAQVLCLPQGPITANMSTLESAETQAIPQRPEVTSTEMIHEDGRLRADTGTPNSSEERRALERERWLADKDAHPEVSE